MEEVCLLWLLSVASVLCCSMDQDIKTKPGADVTLQCQGPKHSDISVVKWIRSDLGSDDYVFFYRETRSYENYQHESFHGRVELRDPEMKGGDVSVILKNITINDNGTYDCYVGIPGSYPKVFSVVHLKVDPVQMNITAEPGQTVTLPCQVPKYTNVKVVEWIRPDLRPGYVLWYQNGRSDPDFQHQSFKNRVELKDSQLKDGDASVILKNVKTDDTGTYECGVLQRGTNQWMSIITLTVLQPGGGAGHTEDGGDKGGGDKDGGKKDGGDKHVRDKEEGNKGGQNKNGGNKGGHVGLVVSLSVFVMLVVGLVIFLKIQRLERRS